MLAGESEFKEYRIDNKEYRIGNVELSCFDRVSNVESGLKPESLLE